MSENDRKTDSRQERIIAYGIFGGLAAGAARSVILHNLALGLSIGLGLGVAFGFGGCVRKAAIAM